MKPFRGRLALFSLPSSIEPHYDGSMFSVSDVKVPSSSDYTIGDLLSAGIKLAPVDTQILHDDDAVASLPNLDDVSKDSSVEPSNI